MAGFIMLAAFLMGVEKEEQMNQDVAKTKVVKSDLQKIAYLNKQKGFKY